MELSLRSLFEKPTVTALAGDVVQRIAERANHDDLASRLAEVEGLSDKEAQRLLDTQALDK